MKSIETKNQVEALIGETYIYAIIIGIIAVVLAFIIACLIKWQGGKNPKDHIIRRIWYIIMGIIAPISFFLYNTLHVAKYIKKASLGSDFSHANIIATLVVLGVYVVVGILTMLLMRGSKCGSILGKSKKI